MKEIIINGVNLSELKAKQEAYAKEVAEVRVTIRQGAAAFIAERIEEAKAGVAKLKEEAEKDEADHSIIIAAAKEATEALSLAEFVASVSGVSYDLPFPESSYAYSRHSSEEIITNIIDDIEIDGVYYWNLDDNPATVELHNALSALYDQAGQMESEVQEWNSSYC